MIGMFDSGIGGLAVLRELHALNPEVAVLYVADQAYAPYGERSLEEVRDRAVTMAGYLIDRGASPIVLACNSASAAALHHLRDRFPDVPFVGMEPAVKPAAERTAVGVIGVLATDATFQGELYASVVRRFANGSRVVGQACAGLAAAIEAGDSDIEALARRYVEPLVEQNVDTIVIGCTHYSHIAPALRRLAGPRVAVIDPAPAVAKQALRVAGATERGSVRFGTTGDGARFATQLRDLGWQGSVVEEVPTWV